MVMLRLGSPFIAYSLLVNLTIGFVNKLDAADSGLLHLAALRHRAAG